ncbi:hypothetical protein D3C85_1631290 [compost metagenome]
MGTEAMTVNGHFYALLMASSQLSGVMLQGVVLVAHLACTQVEDSIRLNLVPSM